MRRYAPRASELPWQLYRARLRTMRTALLAALTTLLTLGTALALWHTPTTYTGRGSTVISQASVMHIITVADTWQAQASLAELPPPPPPPATTHRELTPAPPSFQLLPLPSPPDPVPPARLHTVTLPEPAEPAYFTDLIPSPPLISQPHPTRSATAPHPHARPAPTPPSSSRSQQAAASTTLPSTTKAPVTLSHETSPGTIHPARYRSAPPPPYPTSLRARRISGTVGVLININAEGLPTSVTITSPSGHLEFDDTARRWILQRWKFHPATRSGIPISSQIRTSVRFVLH